MLDQMSRRELGAVLEVAERERERSLVDRPEVEAVDPVEALGPDGHDDPVYRGRVGWRPWIDQRTATEQEGGGRRYRNDRDEDQHEQVPSAAIHDSVAVGGDGDQLAAAPAGIEPVPVLPGA